MTGPTIEVPKASGGGAGAIIISSRKMYCFTASQPVPPYSTGQWATPQPFSFSVRCQKTMSSRVG